MLIVSWFICGVLYFFLYSYLFCTMVCKEKFDIGNKFIVLSLVMSLLQCVVMSSGVEYIRPYVMHILSFLMLKILYKQKFIKTLLGLIIIFVVLSISEFVFVGLCMILFNINFSQAINNFIYYLIFNISICLIAYLISIINIVKNSVDYIIKWYNQNEYKSLMFFVFLILIIFTFALYNNFINILPTNLFIVANLFCIAVFVFVIGFFKEKTTKNKIIYEYDQLLDYIQTYEKLLDEKNKNQHEYKNQLAVIRLMVKNKKTISYIDSLLENEVEQDLEIDNKLMYIPKGGLKGLIHYKTNAMKKKKINVFIDVSSELKDSKYWSTCDKYLQSVSKILGVYLDNAIEASEHSKEKYIIFEVYVEDKNTVFKISNTYSNEINMDKIDKEGYSTKGEGKGYGLALVKDLIEKNDCFSQSREISDIYYIQKLYVKNKV